MFRSTSVSALGPNACGSPRGPQAELDFDKRFRAETRVLVLFARITLVAVFAAAAIVAMNEAQARERSAVFTGPGGQSASKVVTRQQGDVSTTRTGPGGQSMTRSVDRSAGGTQATITGPNGQTASRSTSWGNGSSTSTVTGPNGQSGSVTRSVQP